MEGFRILRDALFISLLGILVYLGVATIIGDSGLIGSYGAAFAQENQLFFGYLSYVYLLVLLVPVFYWYRTPGFSQRRMEQIIAYVLLFFSLQILQALLVSNIEHRGTLGGSFVDFLVPFIGLFGVWVFWVMATAVSVVIILDKSVDELLAPVAELLKRPERTAGEPVVEEVPSDAYEAYDEPLETVSEAMEEVIEEPFDEYDAPAFERHAPKHTDTVAAKRQPAEDSDAAEEETTAAPKTIVSLANKVKEEKHAVIVEELEENTKLLQQIDKGKTEKPKNFKLPSLDFLQKPGKAKNSVDEAELDDKIRDLIAKLAHFKIEGDVVRTYAGPVVSTFEFKPAANIKVSKILNLQDDLAMALRAETIRIQAPIPGKDVVGIEIPNKTVETIYLREIFESKLFKEAASPLTIALGKDIVGKPFITDLKKLPHLLIAGTTGSGKSVGINAMILSLLYKNSPDQLKLMMIDPKMLEFSIYNDIPHLLTPVITKAKQAIVALNNMVGEMERRYQMMSETRTKNIETYNEKMKKEGGKPFPYIVVIIDELADLMMTSGKDVEYSIARLAQMARASGIHLIVATQRPSVDVVTGLIKANLPSRISYRVGQKVDSKIILDAQGAESLLGRGDMLFTPPGSTGLIRLHAPWSSEDEIDKIVEFIKVQREAEYDKSFLTDDSAAATASGEPDVVDEEIDPLYEEAKNIVIADKKTSISYLQRKLQIGYNRSARIIEQLEQRGVLSEPNAKGNREIVGA
ncbi:MAG: DNA translocase FtsK 4TM domain-containing protein [Sulfurimonadaceae bacterium]|nr:DNA translocase FtsK 4TM domain-containing protein [Sulfurimonadaceae bacterium]